MDWRFRKVERTFGTAGPEARQCRIRTRSLGVIVVAARRWRAGARGRRALRAARSRRPGCKRPGTIAKRSPCSSRSARSTPAIRRFSMGSRSRSTLIGDYREAAHVGETLLAEAEGRRRRPLRHRRRAPTAGSATRKKSEEIYRGGLIAWPDVSGAADPARDQPRRVGPLRRSRRRARAVCLERSPYEAVALARAGRCPLRDAERPGARSRRTCAR